MAAVNDLQPRLGGDVMGKLASAIVTVTLAAGPLLLPAPAKAENGQIAAGVVGGLIGGALLGGTLARPAPPPPVYLCARASLCRRACLPIGSRALLGWIWLAIPPSPGLRLIAHSSADPLERTQVNQLISTTNRARLFPALRHSRSSTVATSAAGTAASRSYTRSPV